MWGRELLRGWGWAEGGSSLSPASESMASGPPCRLSGAQMHTLRTCGRYTHTPASAPSVPLRGTRALEEHIPSNGDLPLAKVTTQGKLVGKRSLTSDAEEEPSQPKHVQYSAKREIWNLQENVLPLCDEVV